MRAYHKDGCDYNLTIANKAVNGRVIVLDIPGDMYGECTILLTGGKYASKPLRLTVNTNTEVIGYKRKPPFLGKTVKAQNEKYKKMKFSLAGDDSGRNIKAVFAIANSDFVYPAGEGSGEWETWIPEGSVESVTLRSNDPRRMFSLRLKQ